MNVIYPDNLHYTYRLCCPPWSLLFPSVDILPLHRPSHCPQTERSDAAFQVQQQHLRQEGQNDLFSESFLSTALVSVLVFMYSDVWVCSIDYECSNRSMLVCKILLSQSIHSYHSKHPQSTHQNWVYLWHSCTYVCTYMHD